MLFKALPHYAQKTLFFTLFALLCGMSTAAHSATQNVTINWEYPSTAPEVGGFLIYHNNQMLCETSDSSARQITCPADISSGKNEFVVSAVYNPNDVPTLPTNTSPTAQDMQVTTLEDSKITSRLAATDQENDPLLYTLLSTPAHGTVQLINPATGEYTYTPESNVYGNDSFTYMANDGSADSNPAQVNITISPVNDPPQANAGTDQTVAEQTAVTLTAADSSDIDDGIASFSWTQQSGPLAQITDSSAMQLSFTSPDVGVAGAELSFGLTVTDLGGLQSQDSVTVFVTWTNTAPTANAGTDQTVAAGTTVALDGSLSSDNDDGIAAVIWLQKSGTPAKLSDPLVLRPTFTAPAVTGKELLTFELTVSDQNGLSHTDTTLIEVLPPEQTAGQNVVIEWDYPAGEDQVKGFQIFHNNVFLCETLDPQARQITCPATLTAGTNEFTVSTLFDLAAALSNTETAAATLTAPEETAALSSSMSTSSAAGTTSESTASFNTAPLSQDRQFSTNEDASVQGFLAGTDADADLLTYTTITEPSAGKVELLDQHSGKFLYTPAKDFFGTDSFLYTVSDGQAVSNQALITVTVMSLNDAPVANAGPDQQLHEGAVVKLDAGNSYDIDDNIVSVYWTQLDGPTASISDPYSSTPQFATAGLIDNDSVTLTFQVTITDASGAEDVDTSIVNILWINTPPVANAGPDQSVFESEPVLLDASASVDTDDGIVSYSWSQLSGPVVALSDSSALQPDFTAPDMSNGPASLSFELTVTDRGGLRSQDVVTVNVSWVGNPPVADAGPAQTVYAAESVLLDGTGSYDDDDGIASVQWLQKTGTPVTFANPTALQTTFTAPTVQGEAVSLTFELIVTDFAGLQHTDSCQVDVLPLY
jgi:hypothetical protein